MTSASCVRGNAMPSACLSASRACAGMSEMRGPEDALACSKAYARPIRVASENRRPSHVMPIGTPGAVATKLPRLLRVTAAPAG